MSLQQITNFLPTVKRLIGRVPFMRDALAMYFCATDSATPLHVKTTIIAALVYFLSPVDAIPDAILGLGFTDDAGVIATALATVSFAITPHHWQQADDFLNLS